MYMHIGMYTLCQNNFGNNGLLKELRIREVNGDKMDEIVK